MKKKIIYTIMLISAIAVYFSCSYVPKLNGIDISHHNVVDWKKIRKNKDIEFCYIKATEGKSFRDPMCKKHAKRAKKSAKAVIFNCCLVNTNIMVSPLK